MATEHQHQDPNRVVGRQGPGQGSGFEPGIQELAPGGPAAALPRHPTAAVLRQRAMLSRQRLCGNTLARPRLAAPAAALMRFGSEEHRQIGADASGGASTDIDLGDGTRLTHGEMVALAGDYFGSLDEMRRLARTPEGQAELRWTRWWALHIGSEPALDEAVKRRRRDRYYQLAANNISHFSAGGTARNEYQGHHAQALGIAFMAGITQDDARFSEAMTTEAFGQHFLTDMFSAGHVRTPRQAIREWYAANYPDSVARFVSYTATWITNELNRRGDIPFWLPNSSVSDRIVAQVRTLGGAAVDSFSLGDIVSLAYHDHDCEGLGVVSDLDPNGNPVSGGFRWSAKGDGHLNELPDGAAPGSTSITRQMVTAATRASIEDLDRVRLLGARAAQGQCLSDEQIETLLRQAVAGVQPYRAEGFIPREDMAAGNAQMTWQWGQLDDVLRAAVDRAIKQTVAGQLRARAGQIAPPDGIFRINIPADWLPGMGPYMAPGGVQVAELHVREAFLAYCDHLGAEGIEVINRAMGAPAAIPAAEGMDAGVPR